MKFSGSKNEKQKGGKREFLDDKKSMFEAANTFFKEPIFRILLQIKDKSYFRWARKLLDFSGKESHKSYCSYHQDRGHRTGECHSLRFFIKDQVKEDHLKEYIDETRTKEVEDHPRASWGDQGRNQKRRRELRGDNDEDDAAEPQHPPRIRPRKDVQRLVVIHVIHIKAHPQSIVVRPRAKEQHIGKVVEVLKVISPSSKRPRNENAQVISLSEDESRRVQQQHNDALVVTLKMFESDVKRILVDAGSSTEVMFISFFKKLRLTEEDLEPTKCPPIRFNSVPVWPLGRVIVPV